MRGYGFRTEEQVGWAAVTPLCPFREPGELGAALFQESLPVYAVESVGEIYFNEDGVPGVAVSVAPLAGCLEANLCPQGLGDPDLQGKEV